MRKIILSTLLLAGIYAQAQQVTTFIGKENDDPLTNFNNVTAASADAYFYEPEGLAFDKNGNLYITERNKIRYLIGDNVYNRSGKTGNPSFSLGFKDGTGNAAEYYNPIGIVCASNGDAYIVDSENHAIRKLAAFASIGSGQMATTFAGAETTNPVGGQGTPGDANGTGTSARFNTPKGIAIDATGTLFVTDWFNSTIRKIEPNGNVTTIAGKSGVTGSKDGRGTAAEFNGPYGITMLDNRNVLVTDQINCNIRKIDIVTGDVTTLTGKTGVSQHKDGTLSEATFVQPLGITILDGLIYVCDFSTVRVIDIAGNKVSTLAGSPSIQGNVNGNGANARFGELAGITSKDDAIYVTDRFYHLVKKITIDNLSPRADFSANKRTLLINEATVLTDASGGRKPFTSYQWTITKDGSPATYTLISGNETSSELSVSFATTGFYDVTLKVVNDYGESTVKKDGFFSVSTTGNALNLQSLGLVLYPSPAQNVLYLQNKSGANGKANVFIYDISGRLLITIDQLLSEMNTVDISSLQAGVYVFEIQTDNSSASQRFIKN